MLLMCFTLKSVARIFIITLFHIKVIVNILSLVYTHNLFRHNRTALIWSINWLITNYTRFSEKDKKKFILILMYTKWYVSVLHVLIHWHLRINHRDTWDFVPAKKKSVSRECRQDVAPCFTSVSVAKHLQATCFLNGSTEIEITRRVNGTSGKVKT